MALVQRESAPLAAAIKRMNGLKAVDGTGTLDLGNGHTTQSYQDLLDEVEGKLETYNEARKKLDALKNQLETSERKLSKKSSDMLTAVGLKYGKDSDEYEQCGGVRDSDRKKPARKIKPAAEK